MLPHRIDNITLGDVQSLCDNKIPEGRAVEYKRDLYGSSDDDRRELAADVTAFANANGGDIIFGVIEGEDGYPTEICGVRASNRDEEERRLADIIRMGTEPRYTSFEFKWVETKTERPVLVLRAARSWRGPHRVTLRGHDRFYIRDARGKHPMNTDELKSSFLFGETLTDRIRSFRQDRIALVQSGEGPLPIKSSPVALLHIVPLISIIEPPHFKFDEYEVTSSPLIGGYGFNSLISLDGKVAYSPAAGEMEPVSAYTIQFWNGMVEAVMEVGGTEKDAQIKVWVGVLEQTLIDKIPDYIKYISKKGVTGPSYIFLSLLNVGNSVFKTERSHGRTLTIQRRATLIFPEIMINEIDDNDSLISPTALRPLCDLLWNAFGYPRSWNFTAEGAWKPWT